MQSWGRMRRMAEDVAEKHMDLSWIMNSSTTIDRRGKKRWIKDTLWRSSGEQGISRVGSSDEFVNINLLCLQQWEIVPTRSLLCEGLKYLLALQTKTWMNHLSSQDDPSPWFVLTFDDAYDLESFGTAVRYFLTFLGNPTTPDEMFHKHFKNHTFSYYYIAQILIGHRTSHVLSHWWMEN